MGVLDHYNSSNKAYKFPNRTLVICRFSLRISLVHVFVIWLIIDAWLFMTLLLLLALFCSSFWQIDLVILDKMFLDIYFLFLT